MFKQPTRRGLLPLAVTAAAVAAIPAGGYVARGGVSDEEFVRSLANIHPNGGLAARQALAAGMKPSNLYAVVMPGVNPGLGEPALLFDQDGHRLTIYPTGPRDNG